MQGSQHVLLVDVLGLHPVALLPPSFMPWRALIKCRLGLRLLATKGFQVVEILHLILGIVIHISFRESLSPHLTYQPAPFSPATNPTLSIAYLTSHGRGFCFKEV